MEISSFPNKDFKEMVITQEKNEGTQKKFSKDLKKYKNQSDLNYNIIEIKKYMRGETYIIKRFKMAEE